MAARKRREPDSAAEPPTKRVKPSASPRTKAKPAKAPATSSARNAIAAPRKSAAASRKTLSNSPPNKQLRVYVFGEGSSGELGLGAKNAQDVKAPRLNANLNGVVAVATGGMHGAALTADNKLLTWGVNDNNALGRDTAWDGGLRDMSDGGDTDSEDGDLNPRESTPTAIPADSLPEGTKIAQVAAGDSATFVVTGDGFVYGCGTFRDSNGPFGFSREPKTGKVIGTRERMALVPNLKNITAVATGSDFAIALDSNGHVFAWGSGEQSQLGRRIIERRRITSLTPERVEIPKNRRVVSIHTGSDHAFAIDSNGDTWAWGLNNYAQTGLPDMAGQESASVCPPKKVASLAGKKMKTISGGRHHSVGVTEDGECLVWGRLGDQIGLDPAKLPVDDPEKVMKDEHQRPSILLAPTPLPIPKCAYAHAGTDHTIAITEEGKAYSWGFNACYQCGQGNDEDVLVATPIERKAVQDVKLCWSGAGGQYSMLAAYLEDNPPLTNGVH